MIGVLTFTPPHYIVFLLAVWAGVEPASPD